MKVEQPEYKNKLKSYKYLSRNNIQPNLELRLNEADGKLLNPPLLVEELIHSQ